MRERKNVLLLFSKLPEAGLVKTRLTTLKDGIFAPEVASALYHCMLFDVTEICMAAFDLLEEKDAQRDTSDKRAQEVRDTYELVISTTPFENMAKMEELYAVSGTWPRPITFAFDEGESFDAHYNQAFNDAWARGADAILSLGADMPALSVYDIVRGFEALHDLDEREEPGIVLAPDQEMGVSMIGWNKETAFDHTGIYYNETGLTVLPAYIRKAKAAHLAAILLPPIPDVDTMADLHHNITLIEAANYCAPFDGNIPPWRCADALEQMKYSEVRVMPNGLLDPRGHIDTAEEVTEA